jgi:hypothetical protein
MHGLSDWRAGTAVGTAPASHRSPSCDAICSIPRLRDRGASTAFGTRVPRARPTPGPAYAAGGSARPLPPRGPGSRACATASASTPALPALRLRPAPPPHPAAAAPPRRALRRRLEGPSGRHPMTPARHTVTSATRSAPRPGSPRSLAPATCSPGLPQPPARPHQAPVPVPHMPQAALGPLHCPPSGTTVTPGGGDRRPFSAP